MEQSERDAVASGLADLAEAVQRVAETLAKLALTIRGPPPRRKMTLVAQQPRPPPSAVIA